MNKKPKTPEMFPVILTKEDIEILLHCIYVADVESRISDKNKARLLRDLYDPDYA
jgi:hypothetical protein